MQFGLISEGHLPPGVSHRQRYHEMMREAVFAEEKGFAFYGTSQHHFAPAASVSSPGGLMAYVAARTTDIRLRVMSEVLLAFNHPVLVAERLATLDILSDGRAELCTARSNNPDTLEFFGIDAQDTKQQWRESLELIVAALADEPFEYHGEIWDVPPRVLQPPAVQTPHPALFVAATSRATHIEAGARGLGVVSGNTVQGWDYLEENLAAYRAAAVTPDPIGRIINTTAGVFSATVCCAASADTASEIAAPVAFHFMDVVMKYNLMLAAQSPDYAYIGKIEELRDNMYDLDYLMDHNPYFQVGTPDFLTERFKRIEAMGADELILRIDGMGHENNLASIEMIADHVMPAFD